MYTVLNTFLPVRGEQSDLQMEQEAFTVGEGVSQ